MQGWPKIGFTGNYIFVIVYADIAIWFYAYFLSIHNCNLELIGSIEMMFLVEKL